MELPPPPCAPIGTRKAASLRPSSEVLRAYLPAGVGLIPNSSEIEYQYTVRRDHISGAGCPVPEVLWNVDLPLAAYGHLQQGFGHARTTGKAPSVAASALSANMAGSPRP